MASLPEIEVTFQIEPMVKLSCVAFDCAHNLAHNNFGVGAFCNLKYVSMSPSHQCDDYETDGEIKVDK
jgi:hypothetical protein